MITRSATTSSVMCVTFRSSNLSRLLASRACLAAATPPLNILASGVGTEGTDSVTDAVEVAADLVVGRDGVEFLEVVGNGVVEGAGG